MEALSSKALPFGRWSSGQKFLDYSTKNYRYRGKRANHSLKLTENTACFFAARKNLFREMATRSARIVSSDLAVRRCSLAPLPYVAANCNDIYSSYKKLYQVERRARQMFALALRCWGRLFPYKN